MNIRHVIWIQHWIVPSKILQQIKCQIGQRKSKLQIINKKKFCWLISIHDPPSILKSKSLYNCHIVLTYLLFASSRRGEPQQGILCAGHTVPFPPRSDFRHGARQNDSITQFYRHHERERGIEQQWQNQREMLQVRLRERTIYNRRQAIRQRLGINVTEEELDSWIRSQH